MRAKRAGAELILWTGPRRCTLIRRVLDLLGSAVTPIGVGGPRSQPVSELASALDCTCEDDLRKLIVENPASFLLLAEHEGAGIEDMKAAAASGTTILTLEPPASDFDALDPLEVVLGALHLLPAFSQSPGSLASAHPAEALDERRVAGFDSSGPDATLYARLWDAWATALSYLPAPETIDAALTPASSGATAGAAVIPEQLVQLQGRLTVHGRLSEAGSVVLQLADAAGTSRRSLHVIADNAELRVTDGGYELHQRDGCLLDQTTSEGPTTWEDLIVHQWQRLLDRPGAVVAPSKGEVKAVLACCLATLLSARTGQPERPAELLKMHV